MLDPDVVARMVERFDHHDAALSEGAYEIYEALRAKCPVTRSEGWDGFWVVTDYEHVTQVAHDDATFCSGQGVSLPTVGQARPLLPIESDPPRFLEYRRLLNPRFSPAAVVRYEERAREVVNELIDTFAGRGSCDLVADYAEPFPAILTLELLGLPSSEWRQFRQWIHTTIHESAGDLDTAIEGAIGVYSAVAEAIEWREEHGTDSDDLISYLMRSEIEGEPVTEEEILDISFLTLLGGLDTTQTAVTNALYYMDMHPEVKQALLADFSLIPAAFEEFIRYEAPVQGLARTVTKDTVLGGQQLRAGDKLWMVWASANRDEREFPDPDTVRLDRYPNRHLGFGVGIHRCLGMHLARMEGRVALEAFLGRFPDYRIPPDADVHRVSDTSVAYALVALPAVFEPRPAIGPVPEPAKV